MCAGGLALLKVNQFKLMQDGCGAWKKLNEDFYAKGNVQESIRSYYDLLTRHILTLSSVTTVETYISKFDDYCLKLMEFGPPISDL